MSTTLHQFFGITHQPLIEDEVDYILENWSCQINSGQTMLHSNYGPVDDAYKKVIRRYLLSFLSDLNLEYETFYIDQHETYVKLIPDE